MQLHATHITQLAVVSCTEYTAQVSAHDKGTINTQQRSAVLLPSPRDATHPREPLDLAERVAQGALAPRGGGAGVERSLGLESRGLVVVGVAERAC